jgi:uracil-DNA glycosylase
MNAKTCDFKTFWSRLNAILTAAPTTETVFNQYRDCNDQLDLPDAAARRTENLRRYMVEAIGTASILVIGEAAGPWGCRFSGVPFTGEKQLLNPSFPISGERSSRGTPTRSTRVAPPFSSRSATMFWDVMLPHRCRFLMWDVFPLHSHDKYDVLSVRNPTKAEVMQFREALRIIIEYIRPTSIIAVGKKAYDELGALGMASIYVRHPSRGGQAEFTDRMQKIFDGKNGDNDLSI